MTTLFQKEKRKIIVYMSKIVLINYCFITIFNLELINAGEFKLIVVTKNFK